MTSSDPAFASGILHKAAPYNLLALRDLYTQISSETKPLTRFGADVFLTRGFAELGQTLDQAVGPDYVLGAGDSLTINLWGGVSQTLTRTVDSLGKLTLPDVGPVAIAGLTLAHAQELIHQQLASQFHNIHVELTVARQRSLRVYVVGDVVRPGAYSLNSLSTGLNALYAAGGPTNIGSLRTLKHMRGQRLVSDVDLYQFLLQGMRTQAPLLQDGDTIFVPPAGIQVTVAGSVKRPAIYELKTERTLSEVLDLAGGVQVTAALRHITVDRVAANDHRETVSVGSSSSQDAIQLRQNLAAFNISDGDRINVSSITPWSNRAVYIEGHVVRPGRLPFRDGISVRDIIPSFQELLPEPSDHAEIIRLTPPDLHPEAIEFNLNDAISGTVDIPLRPFDTIRVSGRYETDAPKVTIRGEVIRPGTYSLSSGMTAGQLVKMAGGFTRSALRVEADLASYAIRDGRSVASERTTVPIGDAVMLTNTPADPPLKAGDVLTVHQISGWKDIGASVKLDGEVNYPGTYGLQDGERLSSVLLRAGGFRSSAYPDGAILLRLQVRELEEKTRLDLIHQIESSSVAAKLGTNTTGQDQTGTLQLLIQQQDQVLQRLRSQRASGRMVIHVTGEIRSWQDTPADVELRAGDVLVVPKRPGFVLVSGQVYNGSALTYVPNKSASWYLKRSGGTTELAYNKGIFIVRANGSVIGRHSGNWRSDGVLGTRLNAGDVIVIPQKIVGGSMFWRNALTTAQLFSSIAIPLAIAGI